MLVTDFVFIQDPPQTAANPGPVPIRPGPTHINEAVADLFQDFFGPQRARLIGHACAIGRRPRGSACAQLLRASDVPPTSIANIGVREFKLKYSTSRYWTTDFVLEIANCVWIVRLLIGVRSS